MKIVEGYAEVEDLDAFLEELAAIGEEHDCLVQAVDPRCVAGREHLEHALATAARAIERGEAIAEDPAVELLCYAAGTRQIDEALVLGVGEGRSPVLVAVAALDDGGGIVLPSSDEERGTSADGRLQSSALPQAAADREAAAVTDLEALVDRADLDPGTDLADPERLRECYDIGGAELQASDAPLETLVRERTALLAVDR